MFEDSESQKIGELTDESFLFKEIAWKIPKDKILPNLVDENVQSAPFTFAGATWVLHVYPYGRSSSKSEGWIELVINRIDYKIPQQYVFYKFYFKTVRGKEFNPINTAYELNASCKGGWLLYLKKDIFLFNRYVVIGKGTVTIVCQMRTQKINGIERFSQTESVESVLESEEKITEKERQPSASTGKELKEKTSREEPETTTSACNGCDGISQHPSNQMLQDFKELFLSQEHWDVLIKVKGEEFHAHKAILTARSPVLASTFRNDMKEKASGVLDIEDCDPSPFADFLCFLYCGYSEIITTENVSSLYTVADKYDVEDLRLECVEFMKRNLTVDTFCDIIVLAVQHSEKELIELTTNFFIKNLPQIIVTVKWQSFLVQNPILSNALLIKALASNKK